MMKCSICGKEITSTRGLAYGIHGYEIERDAGGTNHVIRRERTGEIVCQECVAKWKYGVNENQMALA